MGGSGPCYQVEEGLSSPQVLILGCGFTGTRIAKLLRLRGISVGVTTRNPSQFHALEAIGVSIHRWDLGAKIRLDLPESPTRVLHSVPDISAVESANLWELVQYLKPRRVVYLSTTGVYGTQFEVGADSIAQPRDDKGERRVAEEQFTLGGQWSGLVLRPAAIYGPHRGVHTQLRLGREPRARSGMVSRIHGDDLANHALEGLLSELTGAFPVADEHPCSSMEIADFCRSIFRATGEGALPQTPIEIAGRKVDAKKTREALGIGLIYPSYHSGVLASIAQEIGT